MESKDSRMTDDQVEKLLGHENEIISKLAQEVKILRDGIKRHQAQSGHSLCWINDVDLWNLLKDHSKYPHDTLPIRNEFLDNCRAYYESRLKDSPWEDPPVKKTITDGE